MHSVLVVDDEIRHCQSLEQYLTGTGYRVSVAGSAERAIEMMAQSPADIVLLDVRLPGTSGLDAIATLRSLSPTAAIIVMTAFGTLETAVSAAKEGVFEYLVKPFSLGELKEVISRAVEQRSFVPQPAARTRNNLGQADQVIGRSPAMQRVFNQIALVAASDVPVLLTGETGTGKEVLARAIHQHSDRSQEPFLPIFMAALSPTIIESELFGHARGAYTGADALRIGLLEQAGAGTVLLDELGDIPLPLQVKLLRAIEQREVTRVGETEPRPIRCRFVAATNKSLPTMIQKGEFREDLYYRLSVFHIELPPLRERVEDIPLLADYFLKRIGGEARCPGISPAALAELSAREWVGNIRELRNAIEHAAIVSRGAPIASNHLPQPAATPFGGAPDLLAEALSRWINERMQGVDPLVDRGTLHEEWVRLVESELIQQVLLRCNHNQSAASRLLGIDPKTLRAKLAQAEKS